MFIRVYEQYSFERRKSVALRTERRLNGLRYSPRRGRQPKQLAARLAALRRGR